MAVAGRLRHELNAEPIVGQHERPEKQQEKGAEAYDHGGSQPSEELSQSNGRRGDQSGVAQMVKRQRVPPDDVLGVVPDVAERRGRNPRRRQGIGNPSDRTGQGRGTAPSRLVGTREQIAENRQRQRERPQPVGQHDGGESGGRKVDRAGLPPLQRVVQSEDGERQQGQGRNVRAVAVHNQSIEAVGMPRDLLPGLHDLDEWNRRRNE